MLFPCIGVDWPLPSLHARDPPISAIYSHLTFISIWMNEIDLPALPSWHQLTLINQFIHSNVDWISSAPSTLIWFQFHYEIDLPALPDWRQLAHFNLNLINVIDSNGNFPLKSTFQCCRVDANLIDVIDSNRLIRMNSD